MHMKRLIESWKYPAFLLGAIGISTIGEWIYFISLNLIVLKETGSAFAVSILYILKPLAALFTNVWSGSLIDRLHQRNLMIALDFIRAVCIALIPLLLSIWPVYSIYFIVFFINMANSMFRPASMAYITKLIPPDHRKRFNSLRALLDSGGFLLGPSIAGMLFLIGTPIFAIYINAFALLISGVITSFMPKLEKRAEITEKLSVNLLRKDWNVVIRFSRKNSYIMCIYFLFTCVLTVMMTAIDSLEAAFCKEILRLSDTDYGFLVSVAGAGIIVGAFVNSVFVKKLPTSLLMGLGSLFVSAGYIIYAFSNVFLMAACGFFVLAFFLAFANTGFMTFYQKNIPVEVMGRVGSIYALSEAALIIIATLCFGIGAQFIFIQFVVILGAVIMFLFSIILCIFLFQPKRAGTHETSI